MYHNLPLHNLCEETASLSAPVPCKKFYIGKRNNSCRYFPQKYGYCSWKHNYYTQYI